MIVIDVRDFDALLTRSKKKNNGQVVFFRVSVCVVFEITVRISIEGIQTIKARWELYVPPASTITVFCLQCIYVFRMTLRMNIDYLLKQR
jgi:hypothetical protein